MKAFFTDYSDAGTIRFFLGLGVALTTVGFLVALVSAVLPT